MISLQQYPPNTAFSHWLWGLKRTGGLLLAGVLSTALATSCQKYEEGPLISFTPPEKRLSNTWTVEYAENLPNAENVTSDFNEVNYTIKIEEDHTFTLTYNAPTRTQALQQREVSGTWKLVEDDQKIRWSFQGHDPYGFLGTKKETSLILKLKKDQLWMRNQAGNLELRFEPQ